MGFAVATVLRVVLASSVAHTINSRAQPGAAALEVEHGYHSREAPCLPTRDPQRPTTTIYRGDNITQALASLAKAHPALPGDSLPAAVVCPLPSMGKSLGNATVGPHVALSVAGQASTTGAAPRARLWARFVVARSAVLSLAHLEMRHQATNPSDRSSELLAGAIRVAPGGLLLADGVFFRALSTTVAGGAVFVDAAGFADFAGCIFDGCRATNDCGPPFHAAGGGGALALAGGGSGVLSRCMLRNSWSGCAGGAVDMRNNNSAAPFSANLTITLSSFQNNSAHEAIGHDIHIYRDGDNKGVVPCPSPGLKCDSSPNTTRCCFDGNLESLSTTLPAA